MSFVGFALETGRNMDKKQAAITNATNMKILRSRETRKSIRKNKEFKMLKMN
jgi:hypothetical protein